MRRKSNESPEKMFKKFKFDSYSVKGMSSKKFDYNDRKSGIKSFNF